jgi:hypothetical protein
MNTNGSNNTATGYQALLNNNTGSSNTVTGNNALQSNISGNNNTATGDSAGYNALGSGNVFLGHHAGANETGSNKYYVGNAAGNTLLYGDLATRQILLGNANPTGYIFKGNRTLNVLGGLLADSVRVALSAQWVDYVFDENYQLKSLDEVGQFIKANKHLPDIPSAAQVKQEGIELGEMNAKLLAKIEELTLYLLQQQEQINTLKKMLVSGSPMNNQPSQSGKN